MNRAELSAEMRELRSLLDSGIRALRKHSKLEAEAERICSVPGCSNRHLSRGWCSTHYSRWKRTGSVKASVPVRRFTSAEATFDDSYDVDVSGCWVWTAGRTSAGYSHLYDGSGMVYGHRFSFERFTGEIPDGFQIDHLCRNRACVNPDHLEAVPPLENVRRGAAGGFRSGTSPDRCVKGHDLTDPANVYTYPPSSPYAGSTKCRTCTSEARKRYERRVRST